MLEHDPSSRQDQNRLAAFRFPITDSRSFNNSGSSVSNLDALWPIGKFSRQQMHRLTRLALHSKVSAVCYSLCLSPTLSKPAGMGTFFPTTVYHHRENFGNKTYFFLLVFWTTGLYLGNRFAVKVICKPNPQMV